MCLPGIVPKLLLLLSTLLLFGCSDGSLSEESKGDVSYVATVTISRNLVAGSADLAWEDVDRLVITFGSGTQSIARSTLERNKYQVAIATTSSSDTVLSVLGYDKSGNLIASSCENVDITQGNTVAATLAPVYDESYSGKASLYVSWKDTLEGVAKVELVDDNDDSVIAAKETDGKATGTTISFHGNAEERNVRVRLYDASNNQVGHSESQTIRIAANLTSSFDGPPLLKGPEPLYVPEGISDLCLVKQTSSSLSYQFSLPSTYEALLVTSGEKTLSYPYGSVPSPLKIDALASDTSYTVSFSVVHSHKGSLVQSEAVSRTDKTLPPPLVIAIGETYQLLGQGKVKFTATTNRQANLLWSSRDLSVLECLSESEGIFLLKKGGTVTVKASGEDAYGLRSFTFQEPEKGDVAITITGASAKEILADISLLGSLSLSESLTCNLVSQDTSITATWYVNDLTHVIGQGSSVIITPQTPGLRLSRENQPQYLLLVLDDGEKLYSASIAFMLSQIF